MRTVVITGSARGLGLEMAKVFRENNLNVIISDLDEEKLKLAKEELMKIESNGKIKYFVCDVTKSKDVSKLIKSTKKLFGDIDVWINNAGVNQPWKAIWELTEEEIDLILDVDLKGTMICSKLIMEEMIKQDTGAIYNIEGYGSNDAHMLGLSVYGTSKRAITYFTEALAKEVTERKLNICVGKISPGIMITNFIGTSMGDGEKIDLPEKTKKVYNILGDYPDVIAKFIVGKILTNTKNNVKFNWLTNGKAAFRFMTAGFNKRDFFS